MNDKKYIAITTQKEPKGFIEPPMGPGWKEYSDVVMVDADYTSLIDRLTNCKEITGKEVYIYRMVSIHSKGQTFSRR